MLHLHILLYLVFEKQRTKILPIKGQVVRVYEIKSKTYIFFLFEAPHCYLYHVILLVFIFHLREHSDYIIYKAVIPCILFYILLSFVQYSIEKFSFQCQYVYLYPQYCCKVIKIFINTCFIWKDTRCIFFLLRNSYFKAFFKPTQIQAC